MPPPADPPQLPPSLAPYTGPVSGNATDGYSWSLNAWNDNGNVSSATVVYVPNPPAGISPIVFTITAGPNAVRVFEFDALDEITEGEEPAVVGFFDGDNYRLASPPPAPDENVIMPSVYAQPEGPPRTNIHLSTGDLPVPLPTWPYLLDVIQGPHTSGEVINDEFFRYWSTHDRNGNLASPAEAALSYPPPQVFRTPEGQLLYRADVAPLSNFPFPEGGPQTGYVYLNVHRANTEQVTEQSPGGTGGGLTGTDSAGRPVAPGSAFIGIFGD